MLQQRLRIIFLRMFMDPAQLLRLVHLAPQIHYQSAKPRPSVNPLTP